MSLSNPELVVSTTRKMDMLSKQLYIQSNSLEELIALGKNQEERSKCIPAIQPIANKDLKRTASGYGVRIRPDLPHSTLPLRHGLSAKWVRKFMQPATESLPLPPGNRGMETV